MLNQKENIINPEDQTGESFDLSPQISPETLPKADREASLTPTPENSQLVENLEAPAENLPSQNLPQETNIQEQTQDISLLPQNEKLWELKQMARKNLEQAVAIAKKLDDPWLEDQFHDELMNDPELRARLEAAGKIEKL